MADKGQGVHAVMERRFTGAQFAVAHKPMELGITVAEFRRKLGVSSATRYGRQLRLLRQARERNPKPRLFVMD